VFLLDIICIISGTPESGAGGSYLLHFATLPFACRARDFNGDGALLSLTSQGHAVRLQGAEGDLQLRPGEATGSAILCRDL